MATAEEILRAAADDEEKILIIDNELRTIDIPESVRILGVESDDDVNRLRFSMPRKIGETDLGAFDIQINYINAAGKGDVYFVNDMETGEDTITFSWLVGRFAAQNAGVVHFIVCAKLRQDGEVVKEFNTTTAKLEVLKGIEVGENAEQEYPDVIENILSRLGRLEEGGTGGSSSLTSAQIAALNGMFKVAAYIKADISAEYNAFKTAFGIEDSGGTEPDEPEEPAKTLTGISAVYNGGDVAVGTALTALTGIVVTAAYSDGSTAVVTGYTLSGEIAEGSNAITVSYEGKTATFMVTGVAESGGDDTGVSNDTTWTDGVPYTMTLTADTYIDVNNGSVKSDEDWSSTNQLYCAGASRITFEQSDGVAVINSRYNAFFDGDKQFISSFTMSHDGIDVPDNAAYVALSNKTEIMTVLLATPVA